MLLKHAMIYGFGKWVDYSIDFSERSLIGIYGENESGKSTLHQFILFMLFGLYPKERSFYQPKTSSKLGGRLTVSDSEVGEFTIERFDHVKNGAAICYTEDGMTHDEKWLNNRLHGMTLKTYQAIFSFSAIDLADIHQLREDDIGEVLLGIGLTGSVHIYKIEKRLEQKLGDLFKPFGKKPTINQQLALLKDMSKQLHMIKNEEVIYRNQKEELMNNSNELTYLQEQLVMAKKNLLMLEKKQQALPSIYQYKDVLVRLKNLPDSIVFPENGLERLAAIKDRLLPLQSELTVLQTNEADHVAKMNNIATKLKQLIPSSKAEKFLEQKQSYVTIKNERMKLQEAIKQQAFEIDTELANLQIGLTSDDLTDIHLPFHIEETWKSIKEEQAQINFDFTEHHNEKQFLTKRVNDFEKQLQELELNILPKNERTVLSNKLNEYQQFDYLQKLQEQSEEKAQNLKKRQIKNKNKAVKYISIILLFALISGFLSFVFEKDILFSFSIIGLIVSIIYWVVQKRSNQMIEHLLLQMTYPVHEENISQQEKEEILRILSSDDDLKQEHTSIAHQLMEMNQQLARLDEKHKAISTREEYLNNKIIQQLDVYPFLSEIKVGYWPEMYYALKNLLRMKRKQVELEQKHDKLKAQEQNYVQQVIQLIRKNKRAEENLSSLSHVEFAFAEIENQLKQYRYLESQHKQFTELLKENKQQQQHLLGKIKRYQEEIIGLYDMAQVENEDEYYKKANQLQEKHIFITEKEKIRTQFAAIFSDEQWIELIHEQPSLNELAMKYEQEEKNIAFLEEKIEEKRQLIAKITAELRQMETSETYSDLMHRFEMKKDQLKQFVQDWSVLKVAKEMLSETKRKYRDKYLEKVINRTSYYFQRLTGNAYKKVIAPQHDQPFLVETNEKIRYTVKELSKGTIDQLYISFRLAIAEVMSDEHQLPFIIDDAFVHFDSIRKQRMLHVLASIAKQRQVIFFTCHSEISQLLPTAHWIHLTNPVRVLQ